MAKEELQKSLTAIHTLNWLHKADQYLFLIKHQVFHYYRRHKTIEKMRQHFTTTEIVLHVAVWYNEELPWESSDMLYYIHMYTKLEEYDIKVLLTVMSKQIMDAKLILKHKDDLL